MKITNKKINEDKINFVNCNFFFLFLFRGKQILRHHCEPKKSQALLGNININYISFFKCN